MHKAGIIVPYRDRADQLKAFIDTLNSTLNIEWELIVVEQTDDKPFNRGKLLNVGYTKAKELGCDYVITHDVDLLPVEVDYSYKDHVAHLIGHLDTPPGFKRDNFDEYIGGVTLIPNDVFESVNGYPNDYWGWGFEDDSFLLRLFRTGNIVTYKKVPQFTYSGRAVKIDPTSYIKISNVLDTKNNFSITCTFSIDNMLSDPVAITDNQSIFSIPGFDTTLQYDSFQHFSFQFWNSQMQNIAITSDSHYPDGVYRAKIDINAEEKTVHFYLNDILVGSRSYDKLSSLRKSRYIYLGCGNPDREEKQNWLDGSIIDFSIYKNDTLVAGYSSEDGFIKDSSVREKIAEHYNTRIVTIKSNDHVKVPIPIRLNGKFRAISHSENGYTDGYWKEWGSRTNQLHYYNCKYSKRLFHWYDGLNRLEYTDIDFLKEGNYNHFKVKL